VSLMIWHLRDRFFREAWWRESPLNRVFGSYGRWRRKEVRQINLLKPRFCGTFCFLVRTA
jgi:hypothetical protein